MRICQTAPVNEEPVTTLWSIWRTKQGEDHLVGIRPSTMTGRVSPAISSIDATPCAVTTHTGMQYFEGPCGFHRDAAFVWQTWCAMHGVPYSTDVTEALNTIFRYRIRLHVRGRPS
jgi:hypothetical protein